MRVAVVGKGAIGETLGRKWQDAGHDVLFGVRSPEPSDPAQTSVPQAIRHGAVVLLAVPGVAVTGIIEENAANLAGKIVIDATNNLAGPKMSSVDQLLALAPSSRVFRAFNSLGWENFAEPEFAGGRADLFYCGPPDPEATAVVERLIEEIGLRPIRVGDLDTVDLIDSVTRLWFALVRGGMGRHTAFKVLSD